MPGLRDTRPCANCGKLLTKLVSQARGTRWFCNHACQMAYSPLGANVGTQDNPYRGQQETRPCAVCGTPVTRYLSQIRTTQQWTCSKSCAAKRRALEAIAAGTWEQPKKPRRGDTVACEVCGKTFYRQPAYIAQNRRYCSLKCAGLAKAKEPVIKSCAYCGAEMRLPPSGAARQFCTKRCDADAKIKRPTGRMHNGRPVLENAQGYLTIYEPTHPAASRSGHVLEHRWVMEQSLGRYLRTDEQVDHIDQDRQHNAIGNLQILSPTDHTIKTNGDRKRRELTMEERLAAYERRFGPLPDPSL